MLNFYSHDILSDDNLNASYYLIMKVKGKDRILRAVLRYTETSDTGVNILRE